MATYAVSLFTLSSQKMEMTQVTANSRIEAIKVGSNTLYGRDVFADATDPDEVADFGYSTDKVADAIEIV